MSVVQRIKDAEGNYVRDGNKQDGVGKKRVLDAKMEGKHGERKDE